MTDAPPQRHQNVSLVGRVAVVTGGGTGIGRAIALRLAARGATLALLGRRRAPLEETIELANAGGTDGNADAGTGDGVTGVTGDGTADARDAAGGHGGDSTGTNGNGGNADAGDVTGGAPRHLALSVDVRERAAVDEAFAQAARTLGPLHIVVANAGLGGPNAPGAGDRWDEIVRANLDGCYWSFRAFERHLDGDDGAGWKHAIAISSCVARFGVPGLSAYSAAKAGQLGLVRSLALELAPKRVLVSAICPGWVDTEMAHERFTELAAESGVTLAQLRAPRRRRRCRSGASASRPKWRRWWNFC